MVATMPVPCRRPARRASLAAALGAAALLAACSGYSPSKVSNGQTADQVAESMGRPTARYAVPGGGERIEYARGPMGKQTFMIDMDSGGHVTGWTQVLTEPNFDTVKPGQSQNDVLFRLGTPANRFHIGWQDRDVWNYRYDAQGFCRWFQVSIGKTGRVVDTGYGPDPMCDPGGREPKGMGPNG